MKHVVLWCSTLFFFQFIGPSECLAQEQKQTIIEVKIVSNTGGHKVRVDTNRNIYVLNSRKHNIMVLTPAFKVIRRIGGFGQGPGEFNMPWDFDIDKLNRLWVVDYFNTRIQVLDTDGTSIAVFPVNRSVQSVTCLSSGEVLINNAGEGRLYSKIDIQGNILESFGVKKEIPWLDPMIEKSDLKSGKKKVLYDSYPILLNSSLIRSDDMDNIYLLYQYIPVLRKFNPKGEMIYDVTPEAQRIEQKIKENQNIVRRNILEGALGSGVIFQDIAISPKSGRIFAVPTVPVMIIFDNSGEKIDEIEFVEEETGRPLWPLGICRHIDHQWIGVNDSATFVFRILE
ncbi:MAG: NHL repeat-containing protein [Acidobacteriota bacterium]|nr:NHL repeat-containing protein [Acidobacteriota bacterium]